MNPKYLLLHNPLSFEPISFFHLALGCILWDIDLGLYPSPFSHGHILRIHVASIAHGQAEKNGISMSCSYQILDGLCHVIRHLASIQEIL